MIEVSAYEAKTHLSELLNKVQHGEHVQITKHRHIVAYLVPAQSYKRSNTDTFLALKNFRKGKTLGETNIRELIEEGRR